MALQSRKYPWRTAQANHIELLLTGFLLATWRSEQEKQFSVKIK